jgi:hypothetical protein
MIKQVTGPARMSWWDWFFGGGEGPNGSGGAKG